MLTKLNYTNISFKSNFEDKMASIPEIDERFTTPESKAKTVTILGSSKSTNEILTSMNLCSKLTADLVRSGYNIQTGCGSQGIMGSAYNTAKEHSIKDIQTGLPLQNLAIIMQPAWGDEDLENCIPIGKAISEPDRIGKFWQTSDKFVIFPGSTGTSAETFNLINFNEYSKENPLKTIILVGDKFFAPVLDFIKNQFDSKLLKHSPRELFTILNSKEEILKLILRR